MAELPEPKSRKETYLAKAAGVETDLPADGPKSREEQYLNAIAEGGGGSSINVVQTTGESTSDVMSQKAVTDALDDAQPVLYDNLRGEHTDGTVTQRAIRYALYGYQTNNEQVAIGDSVAASGAGAVAIGRQADARGRASVALAFSLASKAGEFAIGMPIYWASGGYNGTPYRLLTGLYDPQSDHDAANKEYVDGTIGKAYVLTEADYNYDRDGDGENDCMAAWLLEPGLYTYQMPLDVRVNKSESPASTFGYMLLLVTDTKNADDSDVEKAIYCFCPGTNFLAKYRVNRATGTPMGLGWVLTNGHIVNSLKSQSSDNILAAAQGKVLNDKIGGDLSGLNTTDKTSLIAAINEIAAGGGSADTAHTLTTDDCNYDSDNDGVMDTIDLWKLDSGFYVNPTLDNFPIRISGSTSATLMNQRCFICCKNPQAGLMTIIAPWVSSSGSDMSIYTVNINTGAQVKAQSLLSSSSVIDNLTSTSTTHPLSANQGKTLKELIDALDARVTALES